MSRCVRDERIVLPGLSRQRRGACLAGMLSFAAHRTFPLSRTGLRLARETLTSQSHVIDVDQRT